MKLKIVLTLLAATSALFSAGEPKIYKEITLAFGDVYGGNDWGVYLNGERLNETLDEALERYSDTPILSVIVEVNPRLPHNRGVLNGHDLFEDPNLGDRYLIKQGEARKLRFVRTPVTRTEAWARIKEYIQEQELDMNEVRLQSIRFLHREETNHYRWHFIYPRKRASGKLTIFYDLLTDGITHGYAP